MHIFDELPDNEAQVKRLTVLDTISPFCEWDKWDGDCTPEVLRLRAYYQEILDICCAWETEMGL